LASYQLQPTAGPCPCHWNPSSRTCPCREQGEIHRIRRRRRVTLYPHPPLRNASDDSDRAAKKRKVGLSGSASVPAQPSFTTVLERLNEEASHNSRTWSSTTSRYSAESVISHIEAEGGADAWARPPLLKLDEKKDSIGTFALPPYATRLTIPNSLSAN
jgi:hypothetical protein